MTAPVPTVDTHVHAGITKYEPIESVLDQMARNHVDHAVLVQHKGMHDNDYLIECARRHPGRFVIACQVDVSDGGAGTQLEEVVASHPAVQGVRLYLADLFAGLPGALAAWQVADDLGLQITMGGNLAEYASETMVAVVERYQRATLHLEHLAYPDPHEAAPYPTYERALALHRYDHVVLKISGFYGALSGWYPYDDTLRFVDRALATFGPRRMMWGSDFPPVSSRVGYGNAIEFARTRIAIADPADRAQMMGGTAARLWHFGTQA